MSARPVVGILALQGDVREHALALQHCGAESRPVRRPAELLGLQGLIIPGGESTTMDKLTRIVGLREPLREALGSGLPAYGSCAGMIMLADRLVEAPEDQQTLGGLDISVRRNAFGRQSESFEVDLEVVGLIGGPLRAVFIRAPEVVAYGPGVEVLAQVERAGGAPRVVAVRQGRLMATAFHPEMGADPRIHRSFLDVIAAA